MRCHQKKHGVSVTLLTTDANYPCWLQMVTPVYPGGISTCKPPWQWDGGHHKKPQGRQLANWNDSRSQTTSWSPTGTWHCMPDRWWRFIVYRQIPQLEPWDMCYILVRTRRNRSFQKKLSWQEHWLKPMYTILQSSNDHTKKSYNTLYIYIWLDTYIYIYIIYIYIYIYI